MSGQNRKWTALEVAFAATIILALSRIGWQTHRIADAIHRDTSMTMCLHLWEMGESATLCDKLRASDKP